MLTSQNDSDKVGILQDIITTKEKKSTYTLPTKTPTIVRTANENGGPGRTAALYSIARSETQFSQSQQYTALSTGSNMQKSIATRIFDVAHKATVIFLIGSCFYLTGKIFTTVQGHKRLVRETEEQSKKDAAPM